MPLILRVSYMQDCCYRLDPDEEVLNFSDSDDSVDDIRPQTSSKGGEIVGSDRRTCDALVNSDEAASSDTWSERKPKDSIDYDCTRAIELA
jgi:hypothetical protein